MSDDHNSKTGGVTAGSLLGVAFILLKLLKIAPIASWSWWWVLAPFWLPITAIAFVVFVVFIFKVVFFSK